MIKFEILFPGDILQQPVLFPKLQVVDVAIDVLNTHSKHYAFLLRFINNSALYVNIAMFPLHAYTGMLTIDSNLAFLISWTVIRCLQIQYLKSHS